jgi:hypothetical protein
VATGAEAMQQGVTSVYRGREAVGGCSHPLCDAGSLRVVLTPSHIGLDDCNLEIRVGSCRFSEA